MLLNNLAPKLIESIRWLMIFGIAATLAQSVLFFISGPQLSDDRLEVTQSTRAAQPKQAVSVNAILSRHLFGVAGQKAAVTEAPAVETRLPLVLRGVFVGDVPAGSLAMVAQKGKTEESYSIGELLPGNAELIEVHPDHIVLRRAGTRETLKFPQLSGKPLTQLTSPAQRGARADGRRKFGSNGRLQRPSGATSPQLSGQASNGSPTSAREFVDSYRDKMDTDPDAVLRDLGIAPVNADGSGGYRVGKGDIARYAPLGQSGLHPGDVVLAVNGEPVGNIRKDWKRINSIMNSGQVTLDVQRGTRRFKITPSIK